VGVGAAPSGELSASGDNYTGENAMSNRKKPAAEKVHVQAAAADRVVVGYIHPGQTSSYFTESLCNMLMWDQATSHRIVGCINQWSSANISPARNSVNAQFLERDADWLLWIDADMAFPHTALDDLLASADATDRPIVGGLCFGASYGELFPTIYYFAEDAEGRITTQRVRDYPDNELVKCAATGAAFLLVHRSVLETIRDREFNATFPWFQETELAGQPCGEDITFCMRAALCDFPVFVNTAVKIGHHKSTVLNHDMFQGQKEAESVSP
jgi:hypothetical protein